MDFNNLKTCLKRKYNTFYRRKAHTEEKFYHLEAKWRRNSRLKLIISFISRSLLIKEASSCLPCVIFSYNPLEFCDGSFKWKLKNGFPNKINYVFIN